MKRKLEQLFLFLAVGLLSLSDTGSSRDYCEHLWGVNLMKLGYDNSAPLDLLSKTFKRNIFVYTCDKNNSVSFFNKKTYNFPDQFFVPFLTKKKVYEKETFFKDHFEEFAKEKRSGYKMNEKKKFFTSKGNGSDSDNIIRNIAELLIPPMKESLGEYSKYVETTNYQVVMILKMKVYELILRNPEHLTLEYGFIKGYKALPASFVQKPEPFLEFLRTYGTHYMYEASFGGHLRFRTEHISSSLRTSERKEIEKEYRLLYDNYRNNRTLQEKIRGAYVDFFSSRGILQINPSNPASFGTWEASLYAPPNPWDFKKFKIELIGASMVPIIDLIANESIRIELAQAIVYKTNEESVQKYRRLLEIISKKSLPTWEYSTGELDTHVASYERKLAEFDRWLQNVFSDTVSLLTMGKEIHERANNITIEYQILKSMIDFWTQKKIYDELYKAVKTIDKVHRMAPAGYYDNDTGFGDTAFYNEKYKEALPLFHTMCSAYSNFPHRWTDLSYLNEVNDKFNWIKAGNEKYLSLRTMNCEAAGDVLENNDVIEKCFRYTICVVHWKVKEWIKIQNWWDYEKEVPAIDYFGRMLTSFIYKSRWRDAQCYYGENGWDKCREFFNL